MDEVIIKKVNYALVSFIHEGQEVVQIIYGKSNLQKAINDIVSKHNLISSANIDVKIITERRAITIEDFLKHSEVIL